MSGKGRRFNSLDISAKVRIIAQVETGEKSKKDIASEHGIPASTLSTILKNRETILAFFKTGNTSRKRVRVADYPDVEEACLKWYKQYSEDPTNLIMGTRIREVAEQCAKSLGHNEFKASNGWLDKFKKRHNIVLQRKAPCESTVSVSTIADVYDSWENRIAALTVDYEPENIFAAEETGLFYKCLPDKAHNLKDIDCYGDKFSNERVTVLLVTNATGTEKVKPYVIGNSIEPRCLKDVNNSPVDYDWNNKSWMTSPLFSAWITTFNSKLQLQNRHVIIFMCNSVAHSFLPTLSNVKVHFLPTSPFNLGIISSFKCNYRGEVVKKIIYDFETNKKLSINILHAARMIDKSWRNVSQNTILNCFKQAGIKVQNLRFETTEFTFVEVDVQPQIGINSSITQQQWINVNIILKVSEPITFEEYVNVDENLIVTGLLPNDSNNELYDEDNDVGDCDFECVTVNQARTALNKLRTFFEKSNSLGESFNDIFSSIHHIDNSIDRQVISNIKQKKITDYFNKV